MHNDLKAYFVFPQTPKHRQYEALRAYVVEGLPAAEAAERFGFTVNSLYALVHDFRTGKLNFFPPLTTGPSDRRVTPYVRDQINELRKNQLSVDDIVEQLRQENIELSPSTVERVLKDSGFGKLPRRTDAQRGRTKDNMLRAQAAHNLETNTLKPFNEECQVAGLFVFLPYIIDSGILELVEKLPLPQSGVIGKQQAFLSFLALKLMGGERLCHVRQYDHDVGFGVFAGLNVLPKPTYMGTYSCLLSAALCQQLQKDILHQLTNLEPALFSGQTINLDFHSIPHFGEQSEMEKVWCGARNKAIKGANTFFAQDAESQVMLYANADVLRHEGSEEILNFVDYWKDIKGVVKETLVFDSRLTTYKTLQQLDEAQVKFITLRRRGKRLAEETQALPDSCWQQIKLPIPKRKHHTFLVHESEIMLKGCSKPFRQIIMKDHGRADPTYVITNNRDLSLIECLMVYARRWRIENKLAELIDFFHLNALSSPIMIRIFFDLLLSVVASYLYRRLALDLPRFEKKLAPDIFRSFVDMPGRVRFDGQQFEVRIRKRAHTPIMLGVKKLQEPIEIPWLEGRQLKIIFTA